MRTLKRSQAVLLVVLALAGVLIWATGVLGGAADHQIRAASKAASAGMLEAALTINTRALAFNDLARALLDAAVLVMGLAIVALIAHGVLLARWLKKPREERDYGQPPRLHQRLEGILEILNELDSTLSSGRSELAEIESRRRREEHLLGLSRAQVSAVRDEVREASNASARRSERLGWVGLWVALVGTAVGVVALILFLLD